MKVDFYVLENDNLQQAWHFACSLIEQAHTNDQSVYVHTASKQEAERMDALLWTYQDQSFLPHQLVEESTDFSAPIQIGYQTAPKEKQTVLINLTQEVPSFYQQFSHVIEIVFSDPVVQQLARDRFRQYRSIGCELNTHKVNTTKR